MKTPPIKSEVTKAQNATDQKKSIPKAAPSGDSGTREGSHGSTNPSTFELAVLSAILSIKPSTPSTSGSSTPEEAVGKAMKIWRAAQNFNEAENQLAKLKEFVFEMSLGEWESTVEKYPGDKRKLDAFLSGSSAGPSFDFESEILPGLFPAKGYSANQRLKKMKQLLASSANLQTELWYFCTSFEVGDFGGRLPKVGPQDHEQANLGLGCATSVEVEEMGAARGDARPTRSNQIVNSYFAPPLSGEHLAAMEETRSWV